MTTSVEPAPPPAVDERPPSDRDPALAEPDGAVPFPARDPRLMTLVGYGFYLGLHLLCLGALWVEVRAIDLWVALATYLIRMFAFTAGYHRYFAHRAYATSRPAQFVLAFLGSTMAVKGVIWWVCWHRHHHRYSDTEHDIHSPQRQGFWYAYVGWLLDGRNEIDWSKVRDLARFPELVWLERWFFVPPLLLAAGLWAWLGWSGFLWGFCISTVALWHAGSLLTTAVHLEGTQDYPTQDDSRNNWWVSLFVLGDGWHNNHHKFPGSARHGILWWEYDVTYYLLRALSGLGLIRDLRQPRLAPHATERGE